MSDLFYLIVYGEWMKKLGIGCIDMSIDGVIMFVWDDVIYCFFIKFKDGEVYFFIKEI